MTSLMVVCAVLASIAIGILVAHSVCVAMFAMFRNHQRQVIAARAIKPRSLASRLSTANPASD